MKLILIRYILLFFSFSFIIWGFTAIITNLLFYSEPFEFYYLVTKPYPIQGVANAFSWGIQIVITLIMIAALAISRYKYAKRYTIILAIILFLMIILIFMNILFLNLIPGFHYNQFVQDKILRIFVCLEIFVYVVTIIFLLISSNYYRITNNIT